MERRVVFNADDLGVSAGTNAGIGAAVEAGLVREASLCVTGVAVEAGAALARRLGARLGVGLHLSLTLGTPLAGPIAHLTGADGRFRPLGEVLRACLRRKPDAAAVAREIRAQLERLHALGIEPSHLNGHHHVHVFPVVRDAVRAVAREHAVPYVRLPLEPARSGGRFSPRRVFLAALARKARALFPQALPFVGLGLFDRADYRARFLRIATGLDAPCTEWMLHPRAPDADFARLDHHAAGAFGNFAAEHAALTDPAFTAEVRALGIVPARYSELGARS